MAAPSPRGGGAASFWKKFGNVFFTQAGFLSLMPGNFQSQNRKAHRHAMVVVGLDLRAVELRRENRQRIAFLDHLRAALASAPSAGPRRARIPARASGRGR